MENNFINRNNSVLMQVLSTCCKVIASSENQELIYHSQATVHWAGILSKNSENINVSSIKPDDRKLEIAAFTHEIERAFSDRLDPYNFQSFYLYKYASIIRSSEILEKIMRNHEVDHQTINEIINIIVESTNDMSLNQKAIILREADVLSFFKVSLPNFFMQKISDKLLHEICMHEFKKLTERGRRYLSQIISFSDSRIKFYLDPILNNLNTNNLNINA
jgi:hypothetical protein